MGEKYCTNLQRNVASPSSIAKYCTPTKNKMGSLTKQISSLASSAVKSFARDSRKPDPAFGGDEEQDLSLKISKFDVLKPNKKLTTSASKNKVFS